LRLIATVVGSDAHELEDDMVLLVDDDEDVRESIGDLPRGRGYAVMTAADGAEALAMLAGIERPCIVLLDLVMPGMDGWTFLANIQGNPTLATIPVVIASAHAATHPPTGALGLLRKPFELDDLFRIVSEHCDEDAPRA
jgi:CheY-like chemotaxis protein